MLKFISLCQRKDNNVEGERVTGSSISARYCNLAKIFWLKYIQAEVFAKELHALTNNMPVPTKSSILSLSPFLDRDGIIRVGGRLRNAPRPFAMRHPIVLSSHALVRLLVSHAHLRSLHSGLQLMLNTLRRDYWIIRARSVVRMIIHKCVVCTRERAATPLQLMGDLPASPPLLGVSSIADSITPGPFSFARPAVAVLLPENHILRYSCV